jgi:hypothetical protein
MTVDALAVLKLRTFRTKRIENDYLHAAVTLVCLHSASDSHDSSLVAKA